jgi:hypothetical protein
VFSGVFIAEEADGVGDKGFKSYQNGRCTGTLGGLFEPVLEVCLFH